MISLSSKKIAEVLSSVSNVVDEEVSNVCTDSRNIFRKDLFFALKGEKFDGHDFVAEVMKKGASFVVVEKLAAEVPAIRQILVEDTTKALGQLGAYIRSLYKGKVIGLTGSSGKTTLKEEMKFLLQKFAPTYATKANFNNHIGVPQSLIDLDMNADYAVIEMGMSAKGELSYLTSLVEPDIAIVNNVYPMHIEFFKGLEDIARAKAEIFEGLGKKGIAVINRDTNFAALLKATASEYTKDIRGFGKENILEVDGTKIKARIGKHEISYELDSEGEHKIYNSLAVLTVIDALGLNLTEAANYLKEFEELPGRGKRSVLKLPNGGAYTLIDDSYSGQPEAMKLAILSLGAVKTEGRKIAVVGKMAELGSFSEEKHIEIGKVLAGTDIDIVIGVKPETKDVLAQLPSRMEQHYFENKDGLYEFLVNKLLQNGDILLIKGARYSSELYKVVESLLAKEGK